MLPRCEVGNKSARRSGGHRRPEQIEKSDDPDNPTTCENALLQLREYVHLVTPAAPLGSEGQLGMTVPTEFD